MGNPSCRSKWKAQHQRSSGFGAGDDAGNARSRMRARTDKIEFADDIVAIMGSEIGPATGAIAGLKDRSVDPCRLETDGKGEAPSPAPTTTAFLMPATPQIS